MTITKVFSRLSNLVSALHRYKSMYKSMTTNFDQRWRVMRASPFSFGILATGNYQQRTLKQWLLYMTLRMMVIIILYTLGSDI